MSREFIIKEHPLFPYDEEDKPQELIRCRECKWLDSGKNDSETWSMCTRHFGEYFNVNADDFCSYGCRSEKPNNSKERSSE